MVQRGPCKLHGASQVPRQLQRPSGHVVIIGPIVCSRDQVSRAAWRLLSGQALQLPEQNTADAMAMGMLRRSQAPEVAVS